MNNIKKLIALFGMALLVSCGGNAVVQPEVKTPNTIPNTPPAIKPATPTAKAGAGGYYLDDGPGDNAPANIDGIPDAPLKSEVPLPRANKPYIALGQQYSPMTSYVPYKKQGVASWYGKRYHGKKTSTGEIYDMYGMSGAHTVLPIPSYAKVTNPANGRSVVVRINDRGPFKRDRLIDLSYAAAYKLRLIDSGSGLVEVETIDTSAAALLNQPKLPTTATQISNASAPASTANTDVTLTPIADSTATASTPTISTVPASTPAIPTPAIASTPAPAIMQYYVQAGAFKSEANGQLLIKKIQGLQLAENVDVASVYNNTLYRVRLGPYANRSAADASAANIRKQLNISAIVQN
jgi:rare lipoprotein A